MRDGFTYVVAVIALAVSLNYPFRNQDPVWVRQCKRCLGSWGGFSLNLKLLVLFLWPVELAPAGTAVP